MKPILLCALLALATTALPGCRGQREAAATAATPVQVIAVARQEVADEVIASGSIEAVDKAEVGFQAGGRILAVAVEDGATVKQGQLLARLDPADYQQTLAIAEARLAEAKSRFQRLSRLHELGSLTTTDFEKAQAACQEAEASARLARQQFGYTELRAPFDGVAVKRTVAAGMVVAPGLPVFTILAPAPVWANVGVAETDARRVAVGQSAQVVLPVASDEIYAGAVEATLPQADLISRSFTAKIRLANPAHRLRPGNIVIAHIATGRVHEALTVPPQVVQKHPDGSLFVWVVDPTRHTAQRQIVETGALRRTDIEIRSGLKAGDQVVLAVPHTLFEGAPLEVVPAR